MSDERWIPGFEDRYAATRDGRIISYVVSPKGREIGSTLSTGIVYATLRSESGERYDRSRARWILETFVGPPPLGSNGRYHDAQHRNGILDDDRVENLKWRPRREQTHLDPGRGFRLTMEERREVARRYRDEDISQTALAAEYGLTQPAISHIVNTYKPGDDG